MNRGMSPTSQNLATSQRLGWDQREAARSGANKQRGGMAKLGRHTRTPAECGQVAVRVGHGTPLPRAEYPKRRAQRK